MLSCKNLTVRVGAEGKEVLSDISASLKTGNLNAVVGPSGCGKTTFMKALLRLMDAEGRVSLGEQEVAHYSDLVGRIGLAPQFSIAHPLLTVEESLKGALDLCWTEESEKAGRMDSILRIVGLDAQRDTRVGSLSGGQLRRLGLALELAPDPAWLICDEVTSGLDPNAEDAILDLLRDLILSQDKTFVCIIHNLAKLERFDWITVMYEGAVVFQGGYNAMLDYFRMDDPLHLYDALAQQPLDFWLERWREESAGAAQADTESPPPARKLPDVFSQFRTVFTRRLKLFSRDRGAMGLIAAITVGFPLLVVAFALQGLPAVPTLPAPVAGVPTLDDIFARGGYEIEITRIGSLVIGLVLFQVVLLTLMGSNNGAREVAAERRVYEKERLRGLNPLAYVMAKAAFVGILSALQGVWMCVFVKTVVAFPGDWLTQLSVFALSGLAMGWISLGFSAIMGTAERASLISVYLVGFQLPLAGIVLKLPEALVWICRPFINAYWAWSGYVKSMADTRYYDAVLQAYDSRPDAPAVALLVLAIQAAAGLGMTVWGCNRMRYPGNE